jgi:hypothetical protein
MLVRATEPQELAQVQTDFVNRQSQKVADQARELGQAMMQHANDMAKTTTQGVTELWRRRLEAA